MTKPLGLFVCLLAATQCPAAEPVKTCPPSILFIVTDDQGAVDVGCYGAKDLVTPNIDTGAARRTVLDP